jgi:hypothetical protein
MLSIYLAHIQLNWLPVDWLCFNNVIISIILNVCMIVFVISGFKVAQCGFNMMISPNVRGGARLFYGRFSQHIIIFEKQKVL